MAALIWIPLVFPLLLAAVSMLWRSRSWTLWLPVCAAVVLLGVGVTAVIAPTENGLHEGTIHIAVDGVRTAAESFPIRAAYQEVERRAGMNACDVLRRALIGSTVVGGRP